MSVGCLVSVGCLSLVVYICVCWLSLFGSLYVCVGCLSLVSVGCLSLYVSVGCLSLVVYMCLSLCVCLCWYCLSLVVYMCMLVVFVW